MRNRRTATALVGACFLALAVLAAAKDTKPADPGKDVNGDNLPAGVFTGKLTVTPGTDGSFTLKVEFDRVQVNPNAVRKEDRALQDVLHEQEHIERLQAEMATTKDKKHYHQLAHDLTQAIQRLQTMTAKAEVQNNGDVKIVKDYKDVDFHAADEVKVRTTVLPVEFDDKGNPKQYTKDELKTLKGKDAELPGYESSLGSLKVGDTIQVTLAPPKPPKKDADKDVDPTPDADVKKGNAVTMIVILVENNSDPVKGKKK